MNKSHRLSLLAVLICLFSLTSIAQKPGTPLELNDYIVSVSDTLYLKGMEWGKAFNSAKNAKDFTRLTPARKSLESYIERKLVDVVTLKDISGSEKLRLTMLDMLFFELRMISTSFKPFESLQKDYTDAELTKLTDQLSDAVATEKAYLDNVVAAQKAYATKHGFTIE